jgi:hypothetical protein
VESAVGLRLDREAIKDHSDIGDFDGDYPEPNSKRMMNTAPYSDQWVDCTDSVVIDVAAKGDPADDSYWPTMIQLDFYDAGCSIIAPDARRLGEMLIAAADSADAIDSARFATAESEES